MRVERLISDVGYYPWRAQPGELDRRIADGSVDDLLLDLMRDSGSSGGWSWPTSGCARRASRSSGCSATTIQPSLVEPLKTRRGGARRGAGRCNSTSHAIAFLGLVEPDAVAQLSRDERGRAGRAFRAAVRSGRRRPSRVVFNAHVPPFDTGLDEAPVLDAQAHRDPAGGTGEARSGGEHGGARGDRAPSTDRQPARPRARVRRLSPDRRHGRVNPGSDYGTGSLNGALVTLSGGKLKAHQLVRG